MHDSWVLVPTVMWLLHFWYSFLHLLNPETFTVSRLETPCPRPPTSQNVWLVLTLRTLRGLLIFSNNSGTFWAFFFIRGSCEDKQLTMNFMCGAQEAWVTARCLRIDHHRTTCHSLLVGWGAPEQNGKMTLIQRRISAPLSREMKRWLLPLTLPVWRIRSLHSAIMPLGGYRGAGGTGR